MSCIVLQLPLLRRSQGTFLESLYQLGAFDSFSRHPCPSRVCAAVYFNTLRVFKMQGCGEESGNPSVEDLHFLTHILVYYHAVVTIP
jgi:hypothetical protein